MYNLSIWKFVLINANKKLQKSILYQLSVLPLCKELVNVNILSLSSLKRIHKDYLEIKCNRARWLWPDFLFYFWQFVYLWLAQYHLCLISVFYQWPLFDVWYWNICENCQCCLPCCQSLKPISRWVFVNCPNNCQSGYITALAIQELHDQQQQQHV